MTREDLLEKLSKAIIDLRIDHPTRVAIDGVDASGKTHLANELADRLKFSGRQIIRVSVDGFHLPKEIRYRKGRNSPEGYYLDSFDNAAIVEYVLKPLGPNGDRRYRRAIFDFKTDTVVDSPTQQADADAILLMDGVFLLRPELMGYWDLKIFLDVDFLVSLGRAKMRDGYYLGSPDEVVAKYNERYWPGQNLYFQKALPKEGADFVVDNNDFTRPVLIQRCKLGG